MSNQRFSPEFKDEAVRQITQRGYSVKEVAERLGVSTHSLYKWAKESRPAKAEADELVASKLKNQKLKAELRRVQEERDLMNYRRRKQRGIKTRNQSLAASHTTSCRFGLGS